MKQHLALATLVVTLTFAVAPAITPPFSGFTADQLPIPQIDPPIQPAGYAFSIWLVIYLWLVVSAAFGLWRRAADPAWNRARGPLVVSLAIGTLWLAIANASAIWATVAIFAMAAGAITALIRAPEADRWWFQAPIGIYAGWLTAASFVSLGSTAAGYGLVLGSLGWAYVGILGALAVALGVQSQRPQAPEYGATVIWALVGIIVSNGWAVLGVTATAAIGIAVIGAALVRWSRPAVV